MNYQATTKNEIDINLDMGRYSSSSNSNYRHDTLLNRSRPNQHPASAISYGDMTVEDALNLMSVGYFRIVSTIAERNNITDRVEGMICYVKETQETYQLVTGISNQAWVPFSKSIQIDINALLDEINKLNDLVESNKNVWYSIQNRT